MYKPFAWAELRKDDFQRQLTLGGGAWRDYGGFSAKGALSLTRGRIKASEDSGGSVTLEAGLEKPVEGVTAGAAWLATFGSIGSSRSAPAGARRLSRGLRGRFGASPGSFSYHEIAAYATLPMGPGTALFRVSLGVPSYSRAILTESADWTVPLRKRISLTAGIMWEQDELSRTYYSLGVRCAFR